MAIRVARLDELHDGFRRVIRLRGREVLLIYHRGELVALDARCPHQGFSLVGGTVQGDYLRCPRHGWRFNLLSGEALQGGECLTVYPLHYDGKDVLLDL